MQFYELCCGTVVNLSDISVSARQKASAPRRFARISAATPGRARDALELFGIPSTFRLLPE